MGGSRPSPPSPPAIVMPAPTAPTTYQSVVPIESYQDLAGQLRRIQEETGKIQQQRFTEVGTPEQIAARQRGIEAREAAAYLSSLPSGDKSLEQTTGIQDPYKEVRETTEQQLTDAQKAYAEAMKLVGRKAPTPTISETPSWAQRTVT